MSNLFTNALRADGLVMSSVLEILVVHKFRRAPYGGGKFWKGLKEVLAAFLKTAAPSHPLLELLGDSIRRDHGKSETASVTGLANEMLHMPIGPKVQMRRWWTFYDAGLVLDRIWHTMLLALQVWCYARGLEPSEVAAKKQGDEEKQDDESLRVQTLATLMNSLNQRVLRSMLVCFERIWTEHKQYTKHAYCPSVCLEYMQRWANWPLWHDDMMVASLQDSIFRKGVPMRLGFVSDVSGTPGSLLQWEGGGDSSEDSLALWMHVRLAMNMMAQLLLYSTLPSSPPWLFCLLLQPHTQAWAIESLQKIWALIVYLDASHDSLHLTLRMSLPVLRWTVVREVFELLVMADWKLDAPAGVRTLAYIDAMFNGMTNTLGLENGFNDLRDNESRGARHQQRSPSTLQSLSISSLISRYEASAPVVRMTAEVASRCGTLHCEKSLFEAEKAPTSKEHLGLDASAIDASGWESTSPHHFSTTQLPLLHVLAKTDPTDWPHLWKAGMTRSHMVLSNRVTGEGLYVLSTSGNSFSFLRLSGVAPWWQLDSKDMRIMRFEALTNLDAFWAHDYEIGLFTSAKGTVMAFESIDVFSVPEYVARRWLHLLQGVTMRKLLPLVGVETKGLRALKDMGLALLDRYDVSGPDREKMEALLEKQAAKRRRATKETEGGDGVEEGDVEDEHTNIDDSKVPKVLKAMAPAELHYVVNGSMPAGAALMEEETDAGLEFLATASKTAAAVVGQAVKKGPVQSGGARGGASSSSSGMAPVPGQVSSSASGMVPMVAEEPGLAPEEKPELAVEEVHKVSREGWQPAFAIEHHKPEGTTMFCYKPANKKPFWEAKLPKGVVWQSADSNRACNARRRDFHPGLRSEAKAKEECIAWLFEAKFAGCF